MEKREQIIKDYFKAWIDKDSSKLASIFTPEVTYTECYGPEYHGLEQIMQWFSDWHIKGTVLEWSIKQFISQNNCVAVEWFFKCDYEDNIDGFDGVSLITFNESDKITSVKEFQSKAIHNYPYE